MVGIPFRYLEDPVSEPAKTLKSKRFKKGNIVLISVLAFLVVVLFSSPTLFSSTESPPLFANLKSPCADFVGREGYLEELYQEFLAGNNARKLQECVKTRLLWGKGGFGKSEIAIEFANRYLSHFSFVWTFYCDHPKNIDQGYRLLAEELHLSHQSEPLHLLKRKVHYHLENSDFPKPWLLIYDNVEDTFSEYPQRGGAIIVTSQKKVMLPQYISEVKPFTKEESVLLLQKITKEKSVVEMEKLAVELEGIPLLVNYAAHYIENTPGCSVKGYQDLFSSKILQVEGPLWKEVENQRYLKSLATSWQFSLQDLKKKHPLALEWLNLCSYLYPEGIPEKWISEWLSVRYPDKKHSFEIESKEILRSLQNYGIIRYEKASQTFSVHRFFQHMIRETKIDNVDPLFNDLLLLLVKNGENFSYHELSSWEQGKQWYLHANSVRESLQKYSPTKELPSELLASFYEEMAHWCSFNSHHEEGIAMANHAIELKKEKESPEIARLYCGVSWNLFQLSRYPEALTFCDQASEIQSKFLKNDPQDYAYTINIKGLILYEQGYIQEALECYVKSVETYQLSSKKSKKEIHSLLGIGRCLKKFGRYEEALEMIQKACVIGDSFEPTHPVKGFIIRDKAIILHKQGKHREALELFHQSLSQFTLQPFSLPRTWYGIGLCHFELKEYIQAIDAFKKSLQLRLDYSEKTADAQVKSLQGLGWCYIRLGKPKEGLDTLLTQLKVSEQVYSHCPKMTTILSDFQRALTEVKQLGEDIQEEASIAYTLSEQQLGKEHPLTQFFLQESSRG